MARRYAPCVRTAAARSRFSASTLQKVYNRGIGAARTNPGSVRNLQGRKYAGGTKMSPQRWACARVNSFVGGSRKHDLDLRRGR